MQTLIAGYEQDIWGNRYAFLFSNGEEIEFQNLDHIPNGVIHLGIGQDASGGWYPESLLVLQRNVTG